MVYLRELNCDDACCSSAYFEKTVTLRDWWLIKCPDEFEGKRFGVAGIELMASIERRAVRVFTSAPIVNAVDVWTLETSDGICILLKGLINKERTVQGGFSPEIFRHFIFGFPPRWEEISYKCFQGESSTCVPGTESVSLRMDTADRPILTPCKNKKSPQSRSKTSIGEINTAEANDEDGNNEDSGSPELNMAVPRANSGDKSRKTQTCSSKRPVSPKEVKGERNTARRSPRFQLKASRNSAENERESYTARVLNSSDCGEHSNSLPTPVVERGNESSNEAKTVDAEKDRGEPSASQVDGFAKRHTGPASKEKKTRKFATRESESLGRRRVKHKATRASPRLLLKEYVKMTESGKKANSNRTAKSVKSDGKVKPSNHSETKVGGKENCIQEEGLTRARTKRRINFDVEATPRKQARKQNAAFVSPESLSTKRSRSGRLLVSTLEFWRNQVPVYDAKRKIIGIKEGMDATTPIRGKGSESAKRRR